MLDEERPLLAKRWPEMAAKIQKRLLAEGKITKEMIESYVDAYAGIYGDDTDAYAGIYGDDTDAYVEEIVADTYTGMNRTERLITLNLANDIWEIANESRYENSKGEFKQTRMHESSERWHYFVNAINYVDDAQPGRNGVYDFNLDVMERDDGDFVYTFSLKKRRTDAPRTFTAGVDGKNAADAGSSKNSISKTGETVKGKMSAQDGRYRDLMGEKAAKYTKGILCAYRKIKKSLSKTGEGFLYRCTIIPITPFKKTMRSDKDTSGTPETIRTSDPSLRSMAYHVIHGSDVTSNIIPYTE